MARLEGADLEAFNAYHHKLIIKVTDMNERSNLRFVGEYFDSGKRFEANQPGITNRVLDTTHLGDRSIYHYFCNQALAAAGVSGGLAYTYNGVNLFIGFSNPLVGVRKCFVSLTEANNTARWAYEQLNDGTEKLDRQFEWAARASFEHNDMPILNITLGRGDRI